MSSKFLKDITRPSDPFYVRLIKGSDVILPEFTNRGVFYTGTSGFGGNVASNATNPLFDVKDYIYTSGSSSNLDFWGYNYTIPTGMLGKDASFKFNFKTATSNFVVAAYALCTSGNKLIYTSQPITIGTSLYEAVFNIPTDCTGLKLGWQYNGTASGETFEYDNVIFSQWTPQAVNLVEQESVTYAGYSTGTNPIVFLTKDTQRSNEKNLIEVSTVGTAGTSSKYKILKPSNFSVTSTVYYSSTGGYYTVITHFDSANNVKKRSILNPPAGSASGVASISGKADIGDYFTVATNATPSNTTDTFFSITATAISENVVQSWQPSDRIGETIYLPQNVAPRGFISAMGSSIGKTSGTYQGDAYYNLYKVLWDVALNTAGQPYYISSAKGTDALTDWNAGKTITIDESGLFTRAYKSGTTNGVGQKQDDALQGHNHQLFLSGGNRLNRTDTVGSGGASGPGYTSGMTAYPYAGTLETNGTNGTPRTSNETRPINVAKYVFIRYATSEPVVLALPVGKSNDKVYDNTLVSVTGTNWTTTSATFSPKRVLSKSSGNQLWELTFRIEGNASIAVSSMQLSIAGINTVNAKQEIGVLNPTSPYINSIYGAYVVAESNTIDFRVKQSDTAISGTFVFSGTILLTNKPTWADEWVEPGVFVGNVAKNQVAYVKDVKASGTNGGSSVASTWTTRTLNTIEGDTYIVSLSSNQITLKPGEYDIEIMSTFYKGGQTKLRLRGTDGVTYVVTSSRYSDATNLVDIELIGKTKIVLTTEKTFELQYYLLNAIANTGLGNGFSTGENEVFSTIKITKLNGQ